MKNVSEAAKAFGKMGGNATKKKHGKDHFKRISQLGNAKRWGKNALDNANGLG